MGQTSDSAVVCAKERGRTKRLEIEPNTPESDFIYFSNHADFQIIPYDCYLIKLNCCLLYNKLEQYSMKIDILITKARNYLF